MWRLYLCPTAGTNHVPLLPSLVLILLLGLVPGANAFDIVNWLQNPPYTNGATIKEQLQCYALPYGGIGFASHILTYATVLCLAKGLNPLVPCRPLRHRWWNLLLAGVGLLVTLPLTVLTMVRCRRSWQFILIAVWKLVLSVTLSSMAVHAALLVDDHRIRRHKAARYMNAGEMAWVDGRYLSQEELRQDGRLLRQTFRRILWWGLPYSLGAIVGCVGVIDLVVHYIAGSRQLQTITYIFAGVAGGSTLVVAIIAFIASWSDEDFFQSLYGSAVFGVIFGFFVLTILFALYADWVLASIAGDLIGYPSSDNALFFWIYFGAKRLPIFSF